MSKMLALLAMGTAISLATMGCSEGCKGPKDVSEKPEGEEKINSKPIGEDYLDLPLEEQLASIALDSQKAGFVGGNLEDHLNPWNETAKLVLPREAKKERFSQTFDLRQIESGRRILFSAGGTLATDLRHENPVTTVAEKEATHEVESTHVYGKVEHVYKETYTFKNTKRGWEIQGLTRVPVKRVEDGMETAYSRGLFVRLDTAVSVAKKSKDKQAHIDALTNALRYAEAYAESGRFIKDNPNVTAKQWLAAAELAMKSGHITSAMRCYEKANDLDPKLVVPEAGLVMREVRGDNEYTDDELRTMREPPPGPDQYTPDATSDATDDESAADATEGEGAQEPPDLDDEGAETPEGESKKEDTPKPTSDEKAEQPSPEQKGEERSDEKNTDSSEKPSEEKPEEKGDAESPE